MKANIDLEGPRYTTEIHADRLLRMLETVDTIGDACPANYMFKWDKFPKGYWNTNGMVICNICNAFVGGVSSAICPCNEFGAREAIKRSWIALEEGHHI